MKLIRPIAHVLLMLALVFGAGCTKEAKKKRFLERADKAYQADQFDAAEVEYLNVLKLVNLEPTAVGRLGLIYHAQGRLLTAFNYLKKASELSPDNMTVRLKLGESYLALRRVKEARIEALEVIKNAPEMDEGWMLLANAVSEVKELESARAQIEAGVQQKATPGRLLALGAAMMRVNDMTNAMVQFQKALALDPKSSAAQLALGNLYLFQNDLPKAGEALKAAAESSPWRSARRLPHAEFLLRTGKRDEARKYIEEITQKAPDFLPAWAFLGQLAYNERRFDDTANYIQKILARDAANYDALLMKGNLFLVKGEGTNAVVHFDRMVSIYGRAPQVQYQLALAHLMNKDTTKASASLTQAINSNTNYTEAIILQAELQLRAGETAIAITSLNQLVKRQPQAYQAHMLLANAYLAERKPDEAVAVYSRAAQMFPASPQVPLLLGLTLAQQGKRPEARKAFEKSLELAPTSIRPLEQLLDLDLLDKKYDAALARAKAAMEKTPDSADPWLLTAKVYMAQNDSAQAEQALLKANEKNPKLQAPYILLARVYQANGKHKEALERLNQLVERTTNNVAALMQIGVINSLLKNYEAARDTYEKIITIDPKFSPALNNLAYIYSERLDKLDRAGELAERARQVLPNDPSAADTLGWILYRKGDLPRALSLLRESAEQLPDEPEVQYHLGMVYYMMGDQRSARAAMEKAQKNPRDFTGKEDIAKRMPMLTIDVAKADATTRAMLEKRVEVDANDPMALSILASIYEREGAVDKATKLYEKALSANKKNAQIVGRLALLYSNTKETDKAMDLAKQARELAPEDARIAHTLGRLVYQSGDHKWAASLLDESARKLPAEAEVQYDQGWAQFAVGRIAEAGAAMQAAIKSGVGEPKLAQAKIVTGLLAALQSTAAAQAKAAEVQAILASTPKYGPALLVSAVLQEAAGKPADAVKTYEEILKLYPEFVPAMRNLAIIYSDKVPDDKKATDYGTKARAQYPDDAELAKALGLAAFRRGEYVKAVSFLKESSIRRPDDAELFYYWGMAAHQMKDKQTKDLLKQALEKKLPQKMADEAKKVMAELNK